MNSDLESLKSNWWSNLLDFGQDVLIVRRKALGLTQENISNKTGLNQSEISRLECGLVRPRDVPTFHQVCKAYRLTETEIRDYSKLITGSTSRNSYNESVLELLKTQVETVYELNRSGYPFLAIRQSQLLRDFVENLIKDPSQSGIHADLGEIFARLTLEESVALWDSNPKINLKQNIPEILKKSIVLTQDISGSNENTKMYHLINLGSISYINKDYEDALLKFGPLITSEGLKKKLWEVETLRMALICSAKVKNYKLFSTIEKRVNQMLVQNTQHSEKAMLTEGLARAYTEFSPEDAMPLIDLARSHLHKANEMGPNLMVRQIQISRSRLEALAMLDNKTAMKKTATEAINQTKTYNLKRYQTQIESIIRRV